LRRILPGQQQTTGEQHQGKCLCQFHIGIRARKFTARNALH
jgi:hypothetical protein